MSKNKGLNRRKFISGTITGMIGTIAGNLILSPLARVTSFLKKLPGTITGTVLGGSDVYIPNSQVNIENTVTKEIRNMTSAYSGKFEFKNLQPGNYRLTVPSMDGFPPLAVELTDGAVVDVSLKIKYLAVSPPFLKKKAITMGELSHVDRGAVSALEVTDYTFGNYTGELKYPPNADGNPRKAVIISWKDLSYRFVFAHECSYCPMIELSSGAGVCYQFFEGNEGRAELFNTPGRRDKNTFVEIMEPGPDRVWVRWTYYGVNQDTGEPYYRGTEDFWAYPNGMIVRKQTYTSLRNDIYGHSREPIEFIGMCPVGKTWVDVLQKGKHEDEYHPLAVLDPFTKKRYDVYWKHKKNSLYSATPRREGANWHELNQSKGVVFVLPMKEGSPFCVFGDASGFRHDFTRIKDHSHVDTGGIGWIGQSWDHWPIGWLNSQAHEVDSNSVKKYPNHFSPAGMDFFALPDEEAEKGVYFSLIGVGGQDIEAIRNVANQWLKKGDGILKTAQTDSGRDLPKL